jgi:hypothetical protein
MQKILDTTCAVLMLLLSPVVLLLIVEQIATGTFLQ